MFADEFLVKMRVIKKIGHDCLQSYIFSLMGAECVRLSPKATSQIHHHRSSESSRVRNPEEMLHFQIIISDLELHCTASNVGKVIFAVQNYFHLEFTCDQFFMLDKMIRCTSQKRASFSVPIKQIEFLDFTVSILDIKGAKIQKVSLKMHAVCEGPRYHDHLLKQMKARIIYNLEVSQLITAVFGCSDLKLSDTKRNDLIQDYGLSLDIIVPGEDSTKLNEKKTIFSGNPEQSQKYTRNNIPSKKLKQSIFRVMMYKANQSGFIDMTIPCHQICIPYMKFWTQDESSVTSQKNGQKIYQKIQLKHYERFKSQGDNFINVYLSLTLKITKIELEQIECLVFSENGLKTVSPYLLSPKSSLLRQSLLSTSELQVYQKLLSKQKKVTYQTKNEIQKTIKQCYKLFSGDYQEKITNPKQLEKVQIHFLNILNSLLQLITEGEDVTNQSIWLLIDKIIHRSQLSVNYFYLIKTPSHKTQIGLKYYGFIFAMLSKIILCTTMGLTYHELKCIQKFIGYVYFRCKWIQNLVVNALKKKDDPQFTPEKLIEIGVCLSNKSPSKSVLYDWQQCLLPHIINEPRYREISNALLETSQTVPNWANYLFNRDDEDLYYGLMIEIWSEGQIFLNNQGRIMWQYFPNYAELLATFLGQMNRNKIIDYSCSFRECSMKLISNQKLLNNFVMFLFPKTCLYQINCVIRCLELIRSYFEVISKKNKKMPNDFNFNYFYTGIKSIFQSNHSYLLIRVIGLLYDYYHILSGDFKKSLDNFIFNKGFNLIFLHWCDYVRRMFYIFLEHRIVLKFSDFELGDYQDWEKNEISYDLIERKNQYIKLIENLKVEQEKIIRSKKKNPYAQKDVYYLKMKQKLKLKKMQKKSEAEKSDKYTSSSLEEMDYIPQLSRKQTQWMINPNMNKMTRKWSDNYEIEDNPMIIGVPEELKKYIQKSMKEYRQIIKLENPDQEIRKIIKIFEGNKSVDN